MIEKKDDMILKNIESLKTRFKAILFDFDYTLVDSSRAICCCFNRAVEELGYPPSKEESICKTIGLPLPAMFTKIYGEENSSKSENFKKHYLKIADAIMDEMTLFYKGSVVTIEKLNKMGLKLGIVSTKSRCRIENFLEKNSISGDFKIIFGAEDVNMLKPDPEGLLGAIYKIIGHNKKEALYVGDSITDAETARRAGVSFAALLSSGINSKLDFQDYDVLWFMENLKELPELLNKDLQE